jgi:hypothetical protein
MRTRESTTTLWVVRVFASRGLILCMQRGVSNSVSFPVSGGESRFMFFRKALRVVLRRVFPCVGCSVVCGGVARGVRL